MKAALVFVVLAVAVALWWFFRKPVAVAPNQYVIPAGAPPSASADLVGTLEGLSTAGCVASGRVAGVPTIGGVCKYTPFNIALKYGPPAAKELAAGTVAVAKTAGRITTDVVGAPVAGAKAAFHAVTSLF